MVTIMHKKTLFSLLSLSLLSSVCHAGGEAPTYYPNVSAISCIMSSSTSSSFFWNNTKECNNVVSSKYAKGVHYKGAFKYDDGSEVAFSGFITPSQGYTPPSNPGKKLTAIINSSATWVNW